MRKIYPSIMVCCIVFGQFLQAQPGFSSVAVPAAFPAGVSPAPLRWLPGDFDNDGDIDVLYQSSNTSGASIFFLENQGDGSYTTTAASSGSFSSGPFNGVSFTLIATPLGVPIQHIGDYDNDGDIDIFELNTSGSRYLRNDNGAWTVGVLPAGFPTGVTAPLRWVRGDFDNDGDVDVLYQDGNSAGVNIYYLQNDGSGSFTTIAASAGTFSSGPFSGISFVNIGISGTIIQHQGDYDDDGDMDIFELTTTSSRLLLNNGGTWSVAASLPTNFPSAIVAPIRWVQCDYDSDGDIDVLYQAVNTANTDIFYLQNNGSGNYTSIAASSTGLFSSGIFSGFAFSNIGTFGVVVQRPFDVDNDGDFDMVEINTSSIRILSPSGSAPALTSSVPADNAGAVNADANIVLNFDQNVLAGSGNIYIRKSADGSVAQTIAASGADVTGSGTSTITINPPADLEALTDYYLTFDKKAFANADGVIFGIPDAGASVMVPFTSSAFLNFSTSSVLPVNLISFTARRQSSGSVLLTWVTAQEQHNSYFSVERGSGAEFQAIGRVNGNGTTSAQSAYSFTDVGPLPAKSYYRLVQYDLDGNRTLSNVLVVEPGNDQSIRIYPNPATDKLVVRLPVAGRTATLSIISSSGQQVYQQQYKSTNIAEVSLKGFPRGVYTVIVNDAASTTTKQIIVQ